jgi:myosin-heavy-chain kinase
MWRRETIRVRLDKYPFQEGTLRSVYFMKDLSRPPGPAQDFVAKISKDPADQNEAYFQDVEMQALAGHVADLFVAMQIPKKCAYVEAAVIECHDRVSPTGGRVVFAIEPLIRGNFIKYTNNYGWINAGAPRNTPQAFSHFSHYVSAGTFVVVDVQGITDTNGTDFYTDPQIHTRGDQPSFGKGDLRDQGIRKFFETHECNSICHALGLPRLTGPQTKPSPILPQPNPRMLWDLRKRKN